uniref:Uncharacterized protein n=1 Tax=Amphora coffeiformis TaxID=265554 RepID=A0A7S3L8D8_9STRA|mmetsp:Transcript_2375/g.4738  ORF Transcript_2375/g.4738 Transcript_2375/m.4738 type:complete len:258 (+) Transcript_2375:46-819(+)|eukprot:scaffold13016_cov154-Amphora_coffeaeformis.AAC.8
MFRRQSSSNLSSSSRGSRRRSAKQVVQGTQAAAEAHLESNKKYFQYPDVGFVSHIEHSLIYAMINEPSIYPSEVIRRAIEDQDFGEFLVANNASSSQFPEKVCSYAQLSALLSLAMQKWPLPSPGDENKEQHVTTNSVPQTLSQALLRTVVQYATEHGLDREHEIAEFLNPAVERTKQRLGRAIHMKFFLPYFAGAALSIATGNPLPLYLAYTGGMVSYLKDDAVAKEKEHVLKVHKVANRASNVETTSLMDEMEAD